MAASTRKQQLLTLKAVAAASPTLNGSRPRAGIISCLRHPMHSRSVNMVYLAVGNCHQSSLGDPPGTGPLWNLLY